MDDIVPEPIWDESEGDIQVQAECPVCMDRPLDQENSLELQCGHRPCLECTHRIHKDACAGRTPCPDGRFACPICRAFLGKCLSTREERDLAALVQPQDSDSDEEGDDVEAWQAEFDAMVEEDAIAGAILNQVVPEEAGEDEEDQDEDYEPPAARRRLN